MINAAVKWLSKHAKINIASISDPHVSGEETSVEETQSAEAPVEAEEPAESDSTALPPTAEAVNTTTEVLSEPEPPSDQDSSGESASMPPASIDDSDAAKESDQQGSAPPRSEEATQGSEEATQGSEEVTQGSEEVTTSSEANSIEATASSEEATSNEEATSSEVTTSNAEPASSDEANTKAASQGGDRSGPRAAKSSGGKSSKKPKKMSPRQRRRRWLVSVLKPLAGKRFAASKLSSFQIVMLGRALRSHVAQCSFEYDAAKLVHEIQRTVAGINRQFESQLTDIVLEHEAKIREAAEAAWWDELHERASARLVGIVADHLRDHINRGCVDAKVVMSIDAVGPRTAATSVVSADGRVLHCEDLPCQLSATLRSQSVAKMGELIHQYHVDLIVISNGPARRGCMVALSDLIGQSPEKSVRWTLADRTGADVYAGSDVANQEMRSTPRRFRAAAWLAFSVLQPAQAFAKVDPLKLRLASFQRELADDAVAGTLENVVISGASRGGVDVNSASIEWLGRLPGMTSALAQAIDSRRRQGLLKSREELLELDDWQSVVESRQALPFLRVFESEEVLDGTLIHPDDYPLAKKLAKSLEIELPPPAPPGYQPPTFETESAPVSELKLSELPRSDEKREIEDVTAAVEKKSNDAFADNVESDNVESDNVESNNVESNNQSVAESPEHPAPEAVGPESSEPAGEPELSSEMEPAEQPAPATETETDAADETSDRSEATAAADSAAPAIGTESEAATSGVAAPATETVNVTAPPPEPVRRPRPDQAKIDKCVKEWQIGARRANQLVHWLCDPFGDSDLSGRPPAVLTSMPSQNTLRPGDEVIGVVVGVMPFGVFVELAPDCSGLVHISKVSDKYVEDLHEAIQVGDVITAWVTGIDQKKRRVAFERGVAGARSRVTTATSTAAGLGRATATLR